MVIRTPETEKMKPILRVICGPTFTRRWDTYVADIHSLVRQIMLTRGMCCQLTVVELGEG